MFIDDEAYAIKKLTQVGYYRLSNFWFICRKLDNTCQHKNKQFRKEFLPNVHFKNVYELYLFDKKLRLLLLDIIERLEVNIRTIMAHELGRLNPFFYKDSSVVNPKFHEEYQRWQRKLKASVKRSQEDFIRQYQTDKAPHIPFWVIVEIWDFGMTSKYYSFLNGKYQNKIAKKFNVNASILKGWLHEINLLRNACAHHSRIWNKEHSAMIAMPPNTQILSEKARKRVFGRIVVLWYLLQQTGSKNYNWNEKLSLLIDSEFPTLPNAKIQSMGIEDNIQDYLF